MGNAQAKNNSLRKVSFGLFSKKEAAPQIASGIFHIHSSRLGSGDPLASITNLAVNAGATATYPWERVDQAKVIHISKSELRKSAATPIIEETKRVLKRNTAEKVETALEELLSNAIFHSYKTVTGKEKYPRREKADLSATETVNLHYHISSEGVFLQVTDLGGTLTIDDVIQSFVRCYASNGQQIDNKESGAGLGLYMVFELITHLKVVVSQGKMTTVSCWIADRKHFDPNNFSFNFFMEAPGE